MFRLRGQSLVVFLVLSCLVGCASGQKQSESSTDPVPAVADEASIDSKAPGSPADSAEASKGSLQEYKIKKGDTLMKIAYRFLGDISRWKEVYQTNKDKIPDANAIPVGVVIQVDISRAAETPEGDKYLIRTGDTLGKISSQLYGTPTRWKEIYEKNKQLIHDPNKIFAGFYIYYTPDSSVGASREKTAPSATAAAGGMPSVPTLGPLGLNQSALPGGQGPSKPSLAQGVSSANPEAPASDATTSVAQGQGSDPAPVSDSAQGQ